MPTATLTFSLPEESWAHRGAVHATGMAAALNEIRRRLRSYRKHGTRSLKEMEAVLKDIDTAAAQGLIWEDA